MGEIVARPDGPFAFRFYFHPLMAAISFAVRDGIGDAFGLRIGVAPSGSSPRLRRARGEALAVGAGRARVGR